MPAPALGGAIYSMRWQISDFSPRYISSVWASCWRVFSAVKFWLVILSLNCFPQVARYRWCFTWTGWAMLGAQLLFHSRSVILGHAKKKSYELHSTETLATINNFDLPALPWHSLRPSKLWQLGAPRPCRCQPMQCNWPYWMLTTYLGVILHGWWVNRLNGSNLHEHCFGQTAACMWGFCLKTVYS